MKSNITGHGTPCTFIFKKFKFNDRILLSLKSHGVQVPSSLFHSVISMTDKGSHLKAPGFIPNFDAEYSVVLKQPLAAVFHALGHGETLEAGARLSDLATGFDLGKKDTLAIPKSLSLTQVAVRTIPASTSASENERLLPRQYFHLEETVRVIFGLISIKVVINGTFTWDDDAKVALYESSADSDKVQIWKLREFEEFEEDGEKKTRAKETIKGASSILLKRITQNATRDALKCAFLQRRDVWMTDVWTDRKQMEKYNTLFK